MQKLFYSVLFATFIAALSFPAPGQERRRDRAMNDMFQGQTPPPGAVTILGRSFFGSLENGFGNSLALLIGADDRNVRQELGLTDTEVNSIRLVRAQMLLGAPKYANQFRTMTEDSQQKIQDDLKRDMERISEALNTAIPQERKEKVQKLAFQTLGGIDSPVIGLNEMEVLNLSDDQKKKLGGVFAEMRDERIAHMETALKMAEKVVAAGGPQNLSQEDREALEKERRELETKSFDTAKKLAERLRQHLTPEQLAMEKELLASRPAFLPPLPPQMRQAANAERGNDSGGGYTPGADSWKPGDPIPGQDQNREQQRERRFPRNAPNSDT